MNFSAFLIWNYSWENPFASCIKGIQDSHGFWIPRRGFRIPVTGFQIFSSGTRIPDSNCQWDSRFLQLYSGFQTSGFRIPLAKISWIPESGFPYMYKGIQDSLGFWIPDSSHPRRPRGSSRRSFLFFMPYFSARLDFPSPPLSAPGSPRMDSSYWIPDLFQWNLDSTLQMSAGFQIPTAVFRFPRDRSPDSKSKNFLDSGIRIPLHWTKSIRVINSGMPSTFQILLTT